MNTLDTSLALLNNSYCSYGCNGNYSDYCGGDALYALNIFRTNLSIYLGYFISEFFNRILSFFFHLATELMNEKIGCGLYKSSFYSSNLQISKQMYTYPTIELCISWCSDMNMSYAVLNFW